MALSKLQSEIEKASRTVSTDDFYLTIGEVVNMYRDGDIIINPNFQRFFRWDEDRKSNLIESILVRIPIPPIFVFESKDSKWELIDGLQRVSSILEFMGELIDPDTGLKKPPLRLVGTQYLPRMNKLYWSEEFSEQDTDIDAGHFSSELQRSFKRAKIGIQLLEKKSDPRSKYDLFQRLNSGGISANDQEIRNCSVIMNNVEFFEMMKRLSELEKFKKMITIGSSSRKKGNDLEQISRIIAFGYRDFITGMDIENFVNKSIIEISDPKEGDSPELIEETISQSFNLIHKANGVDGLRPWNGTEFKGRVGRTSIEVILLGVLHNIDKIQALNAPNKFIKNKTKSFWESSESKKYSTAGVSGTDRVENTIPYGKKWFNPDA